MSDDDQNNDQNEDTSGAWKEALAGDNSERLEALGKFDSADKFLEHYDGMENRNWRDEYAGDDDKFKSELERFSTPEDMGKAYREGRAKISSGAMTELPGENATEDDIKVYREANGIPLEADGYMENLPDGLVVGEDDKEIMSDFMQTLHKQHVLPTVAHSVIEWYNNFAEQQQDAIAGMDAEHHRESEDSLRQTWGGDYRANVNLVGALIEGAFSKEGKDIFINARDKDGRGLMNIPGVMEGLADIGRKWNPAAQLNSPGAADPQKTLTDELAEISAFRKKDRAAYFKDEKMQARERQLLEIQAQHKERSAA